MPLPPAAVCPDLQGPDNGVIQVTGTGYGDTATYSCLPGFALVGGTTRTCQAEGVWSGSEPFCQGKTLHIPE